MENNDLSFEDDYIRGKYTRELRKSFEENNISLSKWWVSPSLKTHEIFISPPPKNYNDWIWENIPTISRISIQIKEGKPSFGVSGYNSFQTADIQGKFKAKGYHYHDKGYDKKGKKIPGRWWLTKTLDNLGCIAGELRDIEPLLFEKD